jgi:L-aminopeptidase/D-esterase-like protein
VNPDIPGSQQDRLLRARDLGIPFQGVPGHWNAITDVPGIEVGFSTLVAGEGPLHVGQGPVRTGVTAILPRGRRYDPVFAAWYSLNGNGEMTGTTWIEEAGFLEGPVVLTNTHSVGVARDAVVAWQNMHGLFDPIAPGLFWQMPVVAETYDGVLSDINGFHVKPEHVLAALDHAAHGAVAEGNIGSGTGMICHEFKGGIGTASRLVKMPAGDHCLGVLVQANHGSRADLTIAGVPLGRELADIPSPYARGSQEGTGSIIAVLATDAPLLPHQLKRLARRVPLGISRVGSHGEHYSGDIFIAFSTANSGSAGRAGVKDIQMLSNDEMNPLFKATVQCVEESIVNALVAARTLTGINGTTAYQLPQERVLSILRRHGRLIEDAAAPENEF